MKGQCEVGSHPRGQVTGKVVRETARAIFQERICPVCGRVQGIARILREES